MEESLPRIQSYSGTHLSQVCNDSQQHTHVLISLLKGTTTTNCVAPNSGHSSHAAIQIQIIEIKFKNHPFCQPLFKRPIADTEHSHHCRKIYWTALLKTSLDTCSMLGTAPFLCWSSLQNSLKESALLVISTSPPTFLSSVHSIQTFHINHFTELFLSRVINDSHFAKANGQCSYLVHPFHCIGCCWSHSPSSNTFFSELLEDHTVLVLLLPK